MKVVIIGVFRSNGEFTDPETKKLVVYDNVIVHAVSGDSDFPDADYSYSSGKWTDSWKLKTEYFLRSFPQLKNPFEEAKGLDVIPYLVQKGNSTKVTGLILRNNNAG